MAKVKVSKGGITLEVEETAVDYYLRTGYKVRKAAKPAPAKPAVIKVQLVEPERPMQPFESPAEWDESIKIEVPAVTEEAPPRPRKARSQPKPEQTEKPKRKPRKKKAE
jgi:hypothetical protein